MYFYYLRYNFLLSIFISIRFKALCFSNLVAKLPMMIMFNVIYHIRVYLPTYKSIFM